MHEVYYIHAYRVISAVWVIAECSEANYYKMAKTTQWLKAIQNYIRGVQLNISTWYWPLLFHLPPGLGGKAHVQNGISGSFCVPSSKSWQTKSQRS